MARSTTLALFGRKKLKGEKIVVITAYDMTSAMIACAGGVDALLVGDSVGMVVLGHETTLPVTIDDMVHHTRAVVRSKPGVPVIADMPYGSFHVSPEETVRHALRLVKEGGASAVKIEGGRKREAVIRAMLDAEIPVMGHLGLTPQSIHALGGYKVQGRDADGAECLREDAAFLEDIGCFSMVLECVPADLAADISARAKIPTIGIGAGAGCDGQVLVFHDLLGLFDGFKPSFVKRYAELGRDAVAAVRSYTEDVRGGVFPDAAHSFDAAGAPSAREKPASADSRGYLTQIEASEEE
jgi:3-methyl-2-oxobutanoate hydroxymethyltransferase